MPNLLTYNLNKQVNKPNPTSTISVYDCAEQRYYYEILYSLES